MSAITRITAEHDVKREQSERGIFGFSCRLCGRETGMGQKYSVNQKPGRTLTDSVCTDCVNMDGAIQVLIFIKSHSLFVKRPRLSTLLTSFTQFWRIIMMPPRLIKMF